MTDAKQAKTFDLTPTWAGIMPGLIAALQNGTHAGQGMARAELMRLAASVDALNAQSRADAGGK